jgi:hypothetical protein
MNHVHRIGPSLARLTRRAGVPTARHAAVPAVPRPGPPRGTLHRPLAAPARTITTSELRVAARPQAPQERLWSRVLPARLPHTIQLCIHCRENPAGFWVSRTADKTVRRPWCLSCCEGLDRDRCDMIPFDS